MKIKHLFLAALALVAASCAKTETNVPEASAAAVPVKITLSMPGEEPQTRMGFEKTDFARPLSLKAVWKKDFPMLLILFQSDVPDNSDWRNRCVVHKFTIPATADGQTSADLTAAAGTVDLTTFDAAKPLKYVITTGNNWHDGNKENRLGNGINRYPSAYDLSKQLDKMIFATPVQQTAMPAGSNPLELTGKLEWLTAALAVNFTIDPSASALNFSEMIIRLDKNSSTNSYPDGYDPVLRKRRAAYFRFGEGIKFRPAAPLAGALDSDGYRYFTIPADDTQGVNVTGSKFSISAEMEGGATLDTGEALGTLDRSKSIEPGKCYGIAVMIKDEDGNGIPEFERITVVPAEP